MTMIVIAFNVLCLLFGVGCPGDGATERVQIRNEADVQMSEIRNNADVAQIQARMDAQIQEAYAEAEAKIGVAQAEAVAQTGVAQAEASANIAWANAATAVGVAEAEANVKINQAWAVALIVFSLGLVLIWAVVFRTQSAAPPHRLAIDGPTWRALEMEAASRGQRLEMRGNTMLLIDLKTNAVVAHREV